MATATTREFDVVIFGATGFTGFFMVRELLVSIDEKPSEYSGLKWAVAGRNLAKLDETLVKLGQELNKDLSKIPKIEANVNDSESLQRMAQRTKVLVNVVGPYKFYGKPVVDACVRSGTHHLDISGEPAYIESCQLEYDAPAKENGALIISTCGWDSIPNDVGVHFLKKNFDGKLHSVESIVRLIPAPKVGYALNFGTYQSIIHHIRGFFEYLRLHSRLYSEVLTKKLPKSRIHLPLKLLPFTQPSIPGWNLVFPGSDKSVVERTQYYNFEHFNERPVQVQTYFNVATFFYMVLMVTLSGIYTPMALLRTGRFILERYPEKLTLGLFSKKGPTREQIDATRFQTYIFGKGWSKDPSDPTDSDPHAEPSRPMDKSMTVLVNGRDPAYLATSTAMIQSALTILKDRDQMPKGGVLTPASAFRSTKLVDRLQARELTFEVVANF